MRQPGPLGVVKSRPAGHRKDSTTCMKRTMGLLLAATGLGVLLPAPGLAQSVPSLSSRMFDNEKTYSATPSVTFSSTVGGGGEFLQYEIQWDTVRGFIAADPAIGSRSFVGGQRVREPR